MEALSLPTTTMEALSQARFGQEKGKMCFPRLFRSRATMNINGRNFATFLGGKGWSSLSPHRGGEVDCFSSTSCSSSSDYEMR